MTFAISIDWHEEFDKSFDKWDNIGKRIAEEICNHTEKGNSDTNMRYSGYCEDCGFSEDSFDPMMNYVYPLEKDPSDEAVKQVVKETNCTVMYNNETDEYFLALTGGGMDLSQDIALAYYYCDKWIPTELALRVSTQYGLSKSGEKWKIVMAACYDSLKKRPGTHKQQIGRNRTKR